MVKIKVNFLVEFCQMNLLEQILTELNEIKARLSRTEAIGKVISVRQKSFTTDNRARVADVELQDPYKGIILYDIEIVLPVDFALGTPQFRQRPNPLVWDMLAAGDRVLIFCPTGEPQSRAYIIGRFFPNP